MENLFFLRFLVSSLIVSGLTLVIMAIKRIGHNHISVKWQYNIWMIFLIMLIIPFIPQQFLSFTNPEGWMTQFMSPNGKDTHTIQTLTEAGNHLLYNEKGIQDFALSVDRSMVNDLNLLCISVWLIGMGICAGITMLGYRKLKIIKRSVMPLQSEELYELFEECKADLKIKKDIVLGKSSLVQTPIAFGIIKTYILLPTKTIDRLSLEDLKYILLHELGHYKNQDIVINYVMCALQIIYWFNPLVYLSFKRMRTDREIACDSTVLKMLDESHHIHYGRTIINFAEMVSESVPLTMTTGIGGSKNQIAKRIEKIAYFKKETKLMKIKSLMIFGLIGILIFSQAPFISVMAYENNLYPMKENQVTYEDLSAYFKGMEGSFVLYDLEADHYSIYNKQQSMKRVSPNSTYKIYSALIGLEEGIIKEGNLEIGWNGEQHPFEAWNQDQDLYSAIKDSVNWYFQHIDEEVGLEKLQYYFDEMAYGNRNLTGGVSSYWMESSLRISPIEQVDLLAAFYTKKLMFQPEHVDLLKEALKLSEKDGARLSGKTGTGIVDGKSINGWFIGYVEREGKTFIFATRVQGEDQAQGSLAMDITLSILEDKGIY